MPNNILITPGSASIQFSGSATNTIRLQVEPSGSVAFYGNSGSLFGITDSLSGSLMSVNDISGLPILEVFSDDRVVMGSYNRNTLVVTGSRVGIDKAVPNADLDVSGSVIITGSLTVVGNISGTLTLPAGIVSSSTASSPSQGTVRVTINGANTDVDTGLQTGDSPTFTGLTVTGTPALGGIPSSSAQIKVLLPIGTVTSSAQYPGWVTASSQIDYNQIQNKVSGVVSTSAQIQPLLPTGVVSSSTQFRTLTDPFTGSFTGSFAGTHTGTFPYASLTGTPSGIVSSSTQVQLLLPGGTVSSSAQYPGWVTSSAQIDYNNIQNKLSGVYSSSTQAVAAIAGQQIAPSNVSASGGLSGSFVQVSGNGIVGGNLTVTGLLTATSTSFQYVTSSQLNVADNKITVNTNDLLRFGGLSVVDSGSSSPVTASIFWDSLAHRFIYENFSGSNYNSAIFIAGPVNTGTTGNESGLVADRIPVGLSGDHIDNRPESSSIRVIFPSRLTHVEAGLFITGALTANGTVTLQGIPSSAAQIKTLLPDGTVSSSAQIPGVVTASAQVATLLPAGTVSSSAFSSPSQGTVRATINGVNTDVDTGLQTGDSPTFSGLTSTGTVLLAGIYSSSGQVTISSTTGYATFSSSIATKNDTQDVSINSLNAATSSYAINSTIQAQLAGVVSSSTQTQRLLPAGTVSSSAQYPGWVTASSQIDYNQIQNRLSGVLSSSAQVQPLLPAGVVSSSAFSSPSQGTVRATINGVQTDVDTGLQTGDSPTFSGLTSTGTVLLAGIYSSSAQTIAAIANQTIAPTTVNATTINASVVTASGLTANQAVFTNASDGLVSNAITGTGNVVMSASPTLTGTITAQNITATGTMLLAGIISSSAQVDYNNIQNKLSGVVSSSTQVATLLPASTVSSSTASSPSQGTVRVTINGVNTDVDTGLQTGDSPSFAGLTVDTNTLYVDATNDRVGIGTTSPSYKLDVNGNGRFTSAIYLGGNFDIVDPSSNSGFMTIGSNQPIRFTNASSTEYMRITTAGNVGIGTTSPQTLLHVAGTISGSSIQMSGIATVAGISSSNHITPFIDNTYNLGAPDRRWANLYTGDLVLSNEGSSGNMIDGTTGNWTIQEGEEYLYIMNNKSGKKYRFMLVEID